MSTHALEQDVIDRPTINPWRLAPTARQTVYATDLCRSELPYAERVATVNSFPALDRAEMSALIERLERVRDQRMARLRRLRRRVRR